MRLRSVHVLLVGLPLLIASGLPALAQYYGSAPPPQQRRDSRAYPPGYYPGKLVRPAPQQGFSLRRLFGVQDPPPMVPQVVPTVRPRRPPPPRTTVVRQEKSKVDATTQVTVFGDALAEFAALGITDAFSESEDVVIIRKAREDGGLIGMDMPEWEKAIDSALSPSRKTNVAVIMLGSRDRQPLRQGSDSFEPLSDKWRELYRGRIDAVMQVFRARNLPVVWIGLPPAKSARQSEDYLALNEIYQESVLRNGGAYVDVWPGFVDEENRFALTGPDVDGETAKLRTADGAFFTRAGARKIAHFADKEIKRLIESDQPAPAVVTVPPDGVGGSTSVESTLPTFHDAVAPVSLPMKPLIGPVLPLNQAVVTPGGTLISSPPKLTGDQAYPARRVLRDGVAPLSKPGRADDFRWPPS